MLSQRGGGVLEGLETTFDSGTRAAANATLTLAQRTDQAERFGFSEGGDTLARFLGSVGERLRAVQSGKLYLYTLILFIWVGAAIFAGMVLWF